MPLFDFICEQHHRTELLRPVSVREAVCPQCGGNAVRGEVNLITMQMGADANWSPLVRDNGLIRTPVSERRINIRPYLEASSELEYEHHRQEQSQGRQLPRPSLARIAQQKARALRRAGVTDSLDYQPSQR